MLSQDFSDFAKAFKSESAGFVDYLGHVASDVVGRGDFYAGDEVLTKTTRSMPLSNDVLRHLQEAEATYALPIQAAEKDAFAAWRTANPLSSLNAQHRHTDDAAKSDGGSPPPESAQMTPNRRSTEWPDEPMDETRQRLLDYNDVVLQRYMALVGDAVSPRPSMPGSPATPETHPRPLDPPSAVKFDAEEQEEAESAGAKEEKEDTGATATAAAAKLPLAPSSAAAAKAERRISEDDFFDRYFFRLWQLRMSEAQRRRDRAAASARDSTVASPVAGAAQPVVPRDASATSAMRASPQSSPTPDATLDDTSRQSTANDDDDDFVAVPLFAKRMMTAASGFVTNIDNALNGVVAAEASRCSGNGVEGKGELRFEDESANVDPSELIHFRGTKQQIAGLESLVQELQETLRHERRRVQQLISVLEAHHIEVPAEVLPSAASTPAKGERVTVMDTAASVGSAGAATPAHHADPATASSSSAGAAAAAAAAAVAATAAEAAQFSGAGASPGAAAVPEVKVVARDDAPKTAARAEKESGVMSAGSDMEEEEEDDDDEAWVHVNPSAEHLAS